MRSEFIRPGNDDRWVADSIGRSLIASNGKYYIRKGMESSSTRRGASVPGRLLNRLIDRLKRQVVGDLCLQLFPPLLVFADLAVFLYRNRLVALEPLIFASAALLGVALAMGFLRYRSRAPVAPYAARLVDNKAGGQDRCLTLATIDPLNGPSFLVDRLRREVAGVLDMIDLRRDFPYRIKRAFFASLIVSFAIIGLIHLFLPAALPAPIRTPSMKELESLIQKMAKIERLSEMARNLETMTARLKQSNLSPDEKRSLIQEARKQIEKQQVAAGQQEGEGDSKLMGEAAKALRGLEQGLEKDREEKGGGGTKANSPEETADSGKKSGQGSESGQGSKQGNKKEERGESQTNNQDLNQDQDTRGGKSRTDENKTTEPAKSQREGSQGRGDKPEKESGKKEKNPGTVKEEREGKGTANPGEEIPQNAPPDRFFRPGEQGESGVKDGRFVAIRLPEEDKSIGETNVGNSRGKKGERRSKVPVSNVPLRSPNTPDAAGEKQYLPLEYRGLIR